MIRFKILVVMFLLPFSFTFADEQVGPGHSEKEHKIDLDTVFMMEAMQKRAPGVMKISEEAIKALKVFYKDPFFKEFITTMAKLNEIYYKVNEEKKAAEEEKKAIDLWNKELKKMESNINMLRAGAAKSNNDRWKEEIEKIIEGIERDIRASRAMMRNKQWKAEIMKLGISLKEYFDMQEELRWLNEECTYEQLKSEMYQELELLEAEIQKL